MSRAEIFKEPIPKITIQRLADEEFGNMVKFVVDLERQIVCAGGGLHADGEGLLLDNGSRQQNLWGANFYLDRPYERRYVYTSMINIRPSDGNSSQIISDPRLCGQIREAADRFFAPFYAQP